MKLTLLGTGSPEPLRHRASSGYLVQIGEERLLFDCGGGVFDRLLQTGHGPGDLDRLFLTHLHTDHMMDFARLVHARWDECSDALKVSGPAPIRTISDRFFGPEGAFAFDLRARTEMPQSIAVWKARGGTLPRPWPQPDITEIEPGTVIEGRNWRVSAFEVAHAQPFLTCMGYRIEAGGKVLVYAGDSGHTPELERHVEGADLLVHWCYRLSHEPLIDPRFAVTSPGHIETARMAQRLGVRHLVLTHLRARHDDPDTHARIHDDVAGVYDGQFSLARDLMSFQL